MRLHTTSVMFVAALALTTSAFAQSERPTTVSLAAGIASGGSDVGAALGGAVLVDLTEFLSVEGLRPDIRALVVFADGKTHTLGVFMANLGYRF